MKIYYNQIVDCNDYGNRAILTLFRYFLFLSCTFSSTSQSFSQQWLEQDKILSSDLEEGDRFGLNVAMHGNYIVVAAPIEDHDENGNNYLEYAGSAYIFEKGSDGFFREVQKIVPSHRMEHDAFGYVLDIHNDVLAIGSSNEFDENNSNQMENAGAVFIFERNSNGLWIESQKIVQSDRSPRDGFGSCIAVFNDIMVIGAVGDDHDANGVNYLNGSGSAYIFQRDSSGNWVEIQKLTANDRKAFVAYGRGCAAHFDNLIVGAEGESHDANNQNNLAGAGAAYVYKKDSTGIWQHHQKLVASDRNIDDRFGFDIDMSESSAIISAHNKDLQSIQNAGGGYVFEKNQNDFWIERHIINPHDAQAQNRFGESVAISDDALVIGSGEHGLDQNGNNHLFYAGAAYIYEKSLAGNWHLANKIVSLDRSVNDRFGKSVDISNSHIVLGTPYDSHVPHTVGPLMLFGSAYVFRRSQISGRIFNDLNGNCILDSAEVGLSQRTAIINPGSHIVTAGHSGTWSIDSLSPGTYSIDYNIMGPWTSSCPSNQLFIVSHPDSVVRLNDYGLQSTQPCAIPSVSIAMPIRRPCFDQNIFVEACNLIDASGSLDAAYVIVELDTVLSIIGSSLPYDSLGSNRYLFNVDTINPGHCVNFNFRVSISCNVAIGETVCMIAELYPADSCLFDSTQLPVYIPGQNSTCNSPWDSSRIAVTSSCNNDSVFFIIKNISQTAGGSMQCHSTIRIFQNGVLFFKDSVQLVSMDSVVFSYPGNGHSWRLQATQHPLFPGISNPSTSIEDCGNNVNGTVGLTNIYPEVDEDPLIDVYCDVTTAAYDPNDKAGFPIGVTDRHFISKNQSINYVIRFQNTGTDTAFNVVVRDTLDSSLNFLSVINGVSSHDHKFIKYGSGILEWTFPKILLPDSGTNLDGSNGFISFKVKQKKDLEIGTTINNSAAIFFDFNAPIITNKTTHTIDELYLDTQWSATKHSNIISCGTYTFFDITFDSTGVYYFIENDTLHFLNLQVINNNDTSLMINNGVFSTSQLAISYQWVNCDNGYSAINGATSSSFKPTGNGTYAVVINNNNCIDTSSCYTISNVFIIESDFGDNFLIYPNPTTGKINIDFNSSHDEITVSLLNVYGQLITKQIANNANKMELDFDGPAGLYLVKISTDNGNTTVLRLVKQ